MKELNLSMPNISLEERRLKVELDKKALYALASDSRLEILKALQTDRRTVSQLAELLKADKAGVHRHLKKLEEGGFVSRDEDHGFVYYSLTWKARDIISPGENTKIIVLISSIFIVLLMIGMVAFMAPGIDHNDNSGKTSELDNASYNNDGIFSDGEGGGSDLSVLAVGLLAVLAAVLLIVTYRKIHTPRQGGAETAESLEFEVKNDLAD